MQMTLTVIYISKSENDRKMTDFTEYLMIAKMTCGVRGVYQISHDCYFSKNRSAAANLFAINNGLSYSILYVSAFFKYLSTKLFWNNLQILSVRKGRLFRPFNKSNGISAAAESSAP